MTKIRANRAVTWRWWIDPECHEYVAACAVLNLTASGPNFDTLVDDIGAAQQSLFEHLTEEGTIYVRLEELGLEPALYPDGDTSGPGAGVDVPLNLIQGSSEDVSRDLTSTSGERGSSIHHPGVVYRGWHPILGSALYRCESMDHRGANLIEIDDKLGNAKPNGRIVSVSVRALGSTFHVADDPRRR